MNWSREEKGFAEEVLRTSELLQRKEKAAKILYYHGRHL